MKRTVVILGGALSGPTAAARAREYDERARIVLLERNTHVSYGATALPFRLSGEIARDDDLDREGPDHFAKYYDVEVRTNTEAVAIDPGARVVDIAGTGGRERIAWDSLVYALGVETRRPDGFDAENIRPLRTMHDLAAIEAAIAAGAKRFAILGGGTLGLEALDGLSRAGVEIALIESAPDPLPRFGEAIRTLTRRALESRAALHLGVRAERIEREGSKARAIVLSNGARIEVDYVLLAPGVKPRTDLLHAAGVPLRDDGAIDIDTSARTSIEGLFACGTCAAVPTRTAGQAWWPQAAIADKTAQVAGANAAGAWTTFSPFVGSMVTRVLSLTVARTGSSYAEACAVLGADRVGRSVVHANAHESALRTASPLVLEVIWDRSNGSLLGLEAAGERAERRAHTAAAAIAGGLSIDALATLDLCYAPAFGSARDPLNVAATIATGERTGLGRSASSALAAGRSVLFVGGGTAAPEGAKSIPLESLRARVGELDPSKPWLVVDETGQRAWLALRILRQRGFKDVVYLAGGERHRSLERGGKA